MRPRVPWGGMGQAWLAIDRLRQIEHGPDDRLRRSRGWAELHSARIGGAWRLAGRSVDP